MEEALNSIPIRTDAYSYVFFLSSMLAFLLSGITFYQSRKNPQVFIILGSFLFCMGALILDLFVARTGYMKYMLWYNDATEFMVLLIGPLLYLLAVRLVSKKDLKRSTILWHLVIPAIYLCYQYFDFVQPLSAKYNAYIGAFHPNLNFLTNEEGIIYDPLHLKRHFERILLVSLLGYGIAGWYQIYKYRNSGQWQGVKDGLTKYTFIIWAFGSLVFNAICFFMLFVIFDEVESHTYVGIILSVVILLIFFLFMSTSEVFETTWVADKYDTTNLSSDEVAHLFQKIEEKVEGAQLFLDPKLSVTKLAGILAVPKNQISQAVNLKSGVNYNDYINQKRIAAAINLLKQDADNALTIEGIGKQVGFSSKSVFYAAFK